VKAPNQIDRSMDATTVLRDRPNAQYARSDRAAWIQSRSSSAGSVDTRTPVIGPAFAVRARNRIGSGAHRLLGEMPLHRRLAGQVDPALAVDLHHDDHHLVADGHDVLDGRHVVVGELADPDEAFLARQDLDERAEAHDPGDLAEVQRPDLDLAGQALDPLDRLARVLARHGRDLHGPVVLDVDLGLGLLLDLADHRAALADDLPDLLRVDLDRRDPGGEVAHDVAGLGQDLGHLVEDRQAGD